MADVKEWTDKYNPFNSDKLFAHYHRWQKIQRGEDIPAPALVTVDPINACNYKCVWCNADYVLGKNKGMISNNSLDEIADFLPKWGENMGYPEFPVHAVCIAGGGEPLLHPYVGKFIEKLHHNEIKSGVVTNGVNIDRHLDSLIYCDWVGVSMDCATEETNQKLKGCRPGEFTRAIDGIQALISYSSEKSDSRLGLPGQGHGVSYKYLLHPGNVHEVYDAAVLAKEIGCRSLHVRPFGLSWDKVGEGIAKIDGFSDEKLDLFKEQIAKARELEDDTFRVFGVTHKFDGNFGKSNMFKRCHAVFMTGVFMPPTTKGAEGFNFGLCCDRRGDDRLTLEDLTTPDDVENFWGSSKHWKMFDDINVKSCPRCTYQPHNQIYENAIDGDGDNMTIDFI